MVTQLKTLHSDKAKSSDWSHQAVDELDYLVTFNRSITQAMARTMQNLSEGIFKHGQPDTSPQRQLLGLLQSWYQEGCFAECPITHALPVSGSAVRESRGDFMQCSTSTSQKKPLSRYHPYHSSAKPSHQSCVPAWKQIRNRQQGKKCRVKASTYQQELAKGSKYYK